MKSNPNPKVAVRWQPAADEPSSAWRRLWAKLLARRKGNLDDTNEVAGDDNGGDSRESR